MTFIQDGASLKFVARIFLCGLVLQVMSGRLSSKHASAAAVQTRPAVLRTDDFYGENPKS